MAPTDPEITASARSSWQAVTQSGHARARTLSRAPDTAGQASDPNTFQRECQITCRMDCQIECQTDCQIYMRNRMPERMPNKMSEYMSDRMPERK